MMYNIIYTDPPWKQNKGGLRDSRPNQTRKLDYLTLNTDDIFNKHQKVMELCEENHTVFMWTIDKFLHAAEQRMLELGYRLHARMIWDKTNGVAPAFSVRYSHEYLLWFYKGKFQPVANEFRGKYTTVFREAATKHSKKPECVYEFIENTYPKSNRLEMYARNSRPNWCSWGNELKDSITINFDA
jgi:N6-adenosine-specific RNA methylase IME4